MVYYLSRVELKLAVQVTPDDTNPEGLGFIWLGPNHRSSVFSSSTGRQNTSTPNLISVLLGRYDNPTDTFPGDITVGDILHGCEKITSQSGLCVTRGAPSTLERLLSLNPLRYLSCTPAHSIDQL